MLLTVSHLNKSFDKTVIIEDATFMIDDHEKVAIVGINGAGKTTLLRMILGKMKSDDGDVSFARGTTIGYLAQQQDLFSHNTLYDEMLRSRPEVVSLEDQISRMEAELEGLQGSELEEKINRYTDLRHRYEQLGGYAYKSEVTGILKGLGFAEDEFGRLVNELSGGQRTRLALAKLLLQKPDIIFLDEPTNHLDISSVSWLEKYLGSYPGAVCIVSHDRYFLDKIVSKIIEVELTKVTVYKGNYSEYARKKQEMRYAQLRAWENQQAFIKHQEDVIRKLRSYNREKSIKRARSREKVLERTVRVDKPVDLDDAMKLRFTSDEMSGNDVLSITGLTKSYNELLFSDVNIEIKRGERVAVIGDNGTGKTTLLKIINGVVEPDAGEIRIGSRVSIGYYDQAQQYLTEDMTLFDEVREAYPDMTDTEIRSTLARFLFTGEDVFKYVADLSGGERARLALAKIILSPSNFLILDEPTNHLDMTSKEVLEEALSEYDGTLLFVSHDRYFVNRIASRILELSGTVFTNYLGNYEYYLEKKAGQTAAASTEEKKQTVTENEKSWRDRKEESARLRKIANEKAAIEARIDELDARNEEINELLTHEDIYTDMSECLKLQKEQEDIRTETDRLFARWEELES